MILMFWKIDKTITVENSNSVSCLSQVLHGWFLCLHCCVIWVEIKDETFDFLCLSMKSKPSLHVIILRGAVAALQLLLASHNGNIQHICIQLNCIYHYDHSLQSFLRIALFSVLTVATLSSITTILSSIDGANPTGPHFRRFFVRLVQ